MIFFSTSDLVCSLRQLLVLYLSFVTLLTFGVRVAPCYVPSISSFMPVTTRSQSKRLNNVNRDHSFYSTLGSSLSSRMSATFSECNLTTTTAVTVSSCNNNTTTSSPLDISTINLEQLDVTHNYCPLFHSSVSSPVSKFQNSKISNSFCYDPGVTPHRSHNFAISNFSTMESDYQDGKNISTATTKSDDAPDLNAFLQAIKLQIEIATDKMAGDFRHVIAANDAFKQEITNANDAFKVNVKQELDDLRQLICQHQLSASSTSASIHGTSSQQEVSSPSTNQSAPILNPVGTSSVNITTSVVSSSTTDQVLLLLTDSFAKMANALTEKSGDTKTEWPKFGGDEKSLRPGI